MKATIQGLMLASALACATAAEVQDIWEPLPGPYADPAKKTAPDFRDMLFAPNGDLFAVTETHGVLRSTDDGDTWTAMGGRAGNLPGTGGNAHCVTMTPKGTILMGSRCPVARYTGPAKPQWVVSCKGIPLYVMRDGKPFWPNDAWTLVTTPEGNVYVVTNLGVYRSADDGQTWEPFMAGIAGKPRGRRLLLDADGRLYYAGNDAPKLELTGAGLYRTIEPVTIMKPVAAPAARSSGQ